jgi:N-terminal domain of reverse transcriptase
MPPCNGTDRGGAARRHRPAGNGADFRLVSRHEITYRTSTRGKANDYASTMLRGCALWLQARIVKATQEGRWNKVKALQWLLTHSHSGKAIAVKRVTENQGVRREVV